MQGRLIQVTSLHAYFNWRRDQDSTAVAVAVTGGALVAAIGGSRAVGGCRGEVRHHRLHHDPFSYSAHRRQALLLQSVHQLIFFRGRRAKLSLTVIHHRAAVAVPGRGVRRVPVLRVEHPAVAEVAKDVFDGASVVLLDGQQTAKHAERVVCETTPL